jgi:hypothetical protein
LFLIGLPLVFDSARSVRAWRAMADEDWSYSLAALPCCRRLRAAGFPRRELMGRS